MIELTLPATSSHSLRRADASDLTGIAEVEHAAHVHPLSRDLLARQLDASNGTIATWCLVNRDTGEVDALMTTQHVLDEVELHDIAVHPRAQRQGLGASLMRALIEASESANVSAIHLEVRASNRGAIALYNAHGFELVGERALYYEGVEDALIMRLTLKAR